MPTILSSVLSAYYCLDRYYVLKSLPVLPQSICMHTPASNTNDSMNDLFGYDSFWRILVCKVGPRAHGVLPNQNEVRRHLRQHHHITRADEQQDYLNYFSSLRCRTPHELKTLLDSQCQPVRPVDYIDDSAGFHCPDCGHLTIQQRPRHISRSRCVSKDWQPCRVQKFFPNVNDPWFRVDHSLRVSYSPPSIAQLEIHDEDDDDNEDNDKEDDKDNDKEDDIDGESEPTNSDHNHDNSVLHIVQLQIHDENDDENDDENNNDGNDEDDDIDGESEPTEEEWRQRACDTLYGAWSHRCDCGD